MHMNATGFGSLTGLVKHLGKSGICEVDETEKGWFIKYIDRSPDTMRKTEADQKRVRMEKNEAEWEQKLLDEQIARALEREIVNDDMDVYTDKLHQEQNDEGEEGVNGGDDNNDILTKKEPALVKKTELIREEGAEKIVLQVRVIATPIQKTQLKRINPFKMAKSSQAPIIEPVKKLTALDEIIQLETKRKLNSNK